VTAWQDRTIEHRNLLNPAFCAVIVWHVAEGYRSEAASFAQDVHMPIELAFVGASLILRGQTREQLPNSVRTSLATWIQDHPLERSAIAESVLVLREYVREALLFGAQNGLLTLNGHHVVALEAPARRVAAYVRSSTLEIRDCMRQATFAGRWLFRAGTAATVLTLVGLHA
jgi:hypothetical protein